MHSNNALLMYVLLIVSSFFFVQNSEILRFSIDKFYANSPGIPFSFHSENYTTDLLINTFIPYSVLLIPSSKYFLITNNIKSNTTLSYDDNYTSLLYETTLHISSLPIPNYLIYFVEDSIWTRDEGLSFSYPPLENYSIIHSLYTNHHIEHMQFSFHNIIDDLNSSFFIGGIPNNSHLNLPYYGIIPINESLPSWGFSLSKVIYKSKVYTLNIPSVISTGISEMFISDELFDLMMNNFFKEFFDNQTCVEYTLKWMSYEHKSFDCKTKIMDDNIDFVFGDVTFRLKPEDVFDKYIEMKDENFSNMYDNYENLPLRDDSDFYNGYGNRRGGYFGNNGIYN